MKTISFTDSRGKKVTRSYRTLEALRADLREELQRMGIKRKASDSEYEKKRILRNMGDLFWTMYTACEEDESGVRYSPVVRVNWSIEKKPGKKPARR